MRSGGGRGGWVMVGVLVLVLASCAGGSSSAPPVTTATTAASTTTATSAAPAASTTVPARPSTTALAAPTNDGPVDMATLLGDYIRLAFAGKTDEALARTCLPADQRGPTAGVLAETVALWPAGMVPTFSILRTAELGQGYRSMAYTIELPSHEWSTELAARVTGTGDDARLCGASTGSAGVVLHGLGELTPATVAWPGAPPAASVAGQQGWVTSTLDEPVGERDTERRVVERRNDVFTLTRADGTLTAYVTYLVFADDDALLADIEARRAEYAQRAHLSIAVPGVSSWGTVGGHLVASYLQPVGLGPHWDALLVSIAGRPATLAVTVENLAPASDPDNDLAKRLLLGLLHAAAPR